MKVLIGYDGSREADRALAGLSQAGLPSDSEALVATVTTPWPDLSPESGVGAPIGLPSAALAERVLEEAQDLADKAVRRLRKLHPGWTMRGEALSGRPAQGLLDRAEAWRPDLLVVGSHGRGALLRLALGSVSLRVLHHAGADVRISRIRQGRSRNSAIRLLLAMDGSAGAEAALAALEARDWPAGTAVRVVAVIDWRDVPSALLKPQHAGVRGKTRQVWHAWIEGKTEEAVGRLRRKGLKATQDILLGDPRRVLLKVAREWKADGIFLGSRGLNAADRFLLGSISSAVAAHAPCAVEVVRRRPATRGDGMG